MRFSVVTIFPEMFGSFLDASLLGKARAAGTVTVDLVDPRDFTTDRHRTVDDSPYGGGPGMVMKAEPLLAAIDSLDGAPHRVLLSPSGAPLTQARARALAALPHVALVCGRYEGVDQRVVDLAIDEELSIGDYVLNGGEVAAMTVIDAVARLIPGVVGEAASLDEESFSEPLLEYPQYTRPQQVRGLDVPEVLRGGNHATIRAWRRERSLHKTAARRPDLLARLRPSHEDVAALERLGDALPQRRSYVVLAHHPVLDRDGAVVTTSVTNLDVHDIARSAATFGLGGYLLVTPIEAQREMVGRVLANWADPAVWDERGSALAAVRVEASLAEAFAVIAGRHGGIAPRVVATSARWQDSGRTIGFKELRAVVAADGSRPLALVFGTGWGLAEEALALVDHALAPIRGWSDYNHLSVRGAVSIALDRLFGLRDQP